MNRRRLLQTFAITPLVVVAVACGSDADDAGPAVDPTLPPSDEPADEPSDDPIDRSDADARLPADGAVIEVGDYGGFTLASVAFQMAPQVLVTADGRLIEPAAVAAIYPGPLLPQHTVSSISEAGIAELLDALGAAGMLRELDLTSSQDLLIADAGTATLVITTADAEYRHEAYALGLAGPPSADEIDPDRIALADALDAIRQPRALVTAGEIGEPEPWVPDAFQFVAFPAGDLSGFDLEPSVVDWPSETGIVLADAGECVEVTREQIGTVFDDANELTFFVDGGVTYQVFARPAYPGRDC